MTKGAEQLVNIILDNAFKYVTDDKYFIELSQNKDSILSVSNSCELINKEDLNKIFDRFYRLDEARTRQNVWNGANLSIAKAIDKHNAKFLAKQTMIITLSWKSNFIEKNRALDKELKSFCIYIEIWG